jgi:hypothetical protein
MRITNCAVSVFAEMEYGRDSKRVKCTEQILNYWYWIPCTDIKYPVKQCYVWQKRQQDYEKLD